MIFTPPKVELTLTPTPHRPKFRRDAPVAQLVEQLTFNQWVTGSIPVGRTKVSKGLGEIERHSAPAMSPICRQGYQ